MEPEYDFCYTESKPETLVMLKNVQSISKLLFADPQLNTFLWIGDRDDQQMMNAKQRIQLQLGEFFYFYSSVQSAKKQLLQDRPQWTVLVISIQMFKEGKQLNSIHKVKSTFFYSKIDDFYYKYMRPYAHAHQNQQIDSQDEEYQQQQNQANDWLQNVYTDQKQLTKKLKEYEGTTTGQKVLPNFVFMAHQIRTSHTLVRTMHSMLNQRIDQETSRQINGKFKTLIGELQQFDKNLQGVKIQMDRECFFNALKDGFETEKQIVNWYTDQTFVYKIINNLLRAHRHPAEVFYIQPYVKLLFNTIHRFYIEESKEMKEKTKIWEFKVYRGGKMDKKQFEMFKKNKGQTIQNLGFFSTTLDMKTAKKFQRKGNTLFQVDVVQNQIGTSQFGFVNIEKWGFGRFGQKQILFNPLNTFQILDVHEPTQGEYFIKLRYRLFDDPQKEKKKQDLEQSWRKIAQLQKQEKYQNECQGNALTNQYYHFQEGQEYWSKYLQLVEESIEFNELKFVYGQWNTIFNQIINKKVNGIFSEKYFKSFVQSFSDQVIDLFGYGHPISIKFLDCLNYSFNYNTNKKPSKNRFKEIRQKDLFEKQPQFMYLNSVIPNRLQHFLKQKQRITKQLNLSNSELNDKAINEIREIFVPQIKQLNLDQNQLTQFPYFIYEMKNLTKVTIKNNNLRYISDELRKQQIIQTEQKNNQLQSYMNKEKDRKKNQVKQIESQQIKIKKEKSQCIDQNQTQNKLIDQLKNIGNLTLLQQLYLSNNQLSSLPESIGNLKSLQYLNLQNNSFSNFPESLGNLASLPSLSLKKNQLSSLPEFIEKLKSLQHLNLSNNQLSSLHESLGNLKSLKHLNLSNNQLSSLHESLGNLKSLKHLNLSNNQLSSLPESLGNLNSLRKLSLKNNQLSSLPEFIGNLKSLYHLNLYNNKLSSLHESIGNLKLLQHLNLQNNQLSSLPESLGNLTSLHSLSLKNNQLSSLPESIQNLKQLLQLSLQNNQLTGLPISFGNLISLYSINLSLNSLQILPESFSYLANLRSLSISNNYLQNLPQQISKLNLLEQLNASNNFLAELPSIQKLINLRIFNVSFNPIAIQTLELISQSQIKILIDQKQMSVLQNQKCSTKSVFVVIDGQAPKKKNQN